MAWDEIPGWAHDVAMALLHARFKRVVFGAVANPHVEQLGDLSRREMLVLGVLAVAVLAMGLYPAPLGEVLHESVSEILRLAAPGRKLMIGL